MPIVVNSNASATEASFNLTRANDALRKSLSRLSSGKRINSPADDAGGLAVPTGSRWSSRNSRQNFGQNGRAQDHGPGCDKKYPRH